MNTVVTDSDPILKLDSDPRDPIGVGVYNLDPDWLISFDSKAQMSRRLQSILRVAVVRTGPPRDDNLPNVFGRYEVSKDSIRFVPHFPFDPGVIYQASFDPRGWGRPAIANVLTLEFSLPRARSALPTVKQIFPSSDTLPENLLRFYVSFSNPMQRGRFAEQIALLGPDGREAPDVLYRAPVELWDRSMQLLTILLDPGRLKRGVGPNRELGPPLRSGQEYTLAIGSGLLDLSGQRLPETVYKRFRVTDAVREPIAVEHWKILVPLTRSRRPLVLLFPRALDWALLSHSVTIASSEQTIDGQISIDQQERRWSFTPSLAWAPGGYQIHIAPGLEDICGNSVLAAFDRPLRSGANLRFEVASPSLSFQLR